MSDRLILALTEQFYEAATGGMPWAPVGEGLIRLVDAGSASLMAGHFAEGRAEILYRGHIPLDAVDLYRRRYRAVDLWTNRAASAAAQRPQARPRAYASGTLVSDAEFLNSEFYVDFGRALGLRYVVGAALPLGEAGVLPIGLHRPPGSKPFDRTDARRLEQVLPHLRRALQLRHRLAASNGSAALGGAALDALGVGVLVVAADLRVLAANAAAEAMARTGEALRFVRLGGGLCGVTALRSADTATMATLARSVALHGAPGGAAPLRDADGAIAVAALVSPMPRRMTGRGGDGVGRVAGQALIMLRPLCRAPRRVDPSALRDLFGLTSAEADVALALAGGATKEAVAVHRAAKVTTVRTQVRAILEKTGAANLRDLERLLASLGGP